MDGISQTRTLGGVVLGAAAAAGSAVYKVLQILTMLWKRDKINKCRNQVKNISSSMLTNSVFV